MEMPGVRLGPDAGVTAQIAGIKLAHGPSRCFYHPAVILALTRGGKHPLLIPPKHPQWHSTP